MDKKVKIKAINVPGKTLVATYTVAVTATDGSSAATVNVNLKVERITSGWQEI